MRLALHLAIALERLIPSGMSSRLYLSRQLDIYGVPRLPKEVIRDLAHQAVELANFVAGPGSANRREYVAIYLKEQASTSGRRGRARIHVATLQTRRVRRFAHKAKGILKRRSKKSTSPSRQRVGAPYSWNHFPLYASETPSGPDQFAFFRS